MLAYAVFVGDRAQSSNDLHEVSVDPSDMMALLSSLKASEVHMRTLEPPHAWRQLRSGSEMEEGCYLKVVLAAAPAQAAAGSSTGSPEALSSLQAQLDNLAVQLKKTKEVEQENQAQFALIQHQLNGASQSISLDKDIGQSHLQDVAEGPLGIFLPVPSEEQYKRLLDEGRAAVQAKLDEQAAPPPSSHKKRKEPAQQTSLPLPDMETAMCQYAAGQQLDEERHMQPLWFALINAMAAGGGNMHAWDMHKAGYLREPDSKIDCALLAQRTAAWPWLVVSFEWKLKAADLTAIIGQLVRRFKDTFAKQQRRQFCVGVAVLPEGLQVVVGTRGENGRVHVQRTPLMQFAFAQGCIGFQFLARIVSATPEQLGWASPFIPQAVRVAEHGQLTNFQVLRQGTATTSQSSVYQASLVCENQATRHVIVKLGCSSQEVEMLQLAKKLLPNIRLAHLVALADVDVDASNTKQRAAVIWPHCRPLMQRDSVELFAQAAFDGAETIGALAEQLILHRDHSHRNFGLHADEDGTMHAYIYDFSTAKKVQSLGADREASADGQAEKLTGTLSCMALSVMEGGPHTLSSELEAFANSLLVIGAEGKQADAWVSSSRNLRQVAMARRGMMLGGSALHNVSPHLHQFLGDLHNLFFPVCHAPADRRYNRAVSVEKFQAVCNKYLGA